jgi:hypothetical protein
MKLFYALLILVVSTLPMSAQEIRGYIRLEANGKVYETETVMIDPGPRHYTVYRQPSSIPYRRPIKNYGPGFDYRGDWGYGGSPAGFFGGGYGGYGNVVRFQGAYSGYGRGYGGYGRGYGGYGRPANSNRGYINR